MERGKRLRKQLEAMSKDEKAQTMRLLRDDELDAVSGGMIHGDFATFPTN